MNSEAKKLHIIEEILKIENDIVLEELGALLSKSNMYAISRRSFKDFEGMMSEDEADELEKTIEEGCETINPNDLK